MKLEVPTNHNGITIGQYQDLHAMLNEPDLSTIEKQCRLVSIACGVPLEEVKKIDLSDLRKAYDHLSFLTTIPKATDYPISFTFDKVFYKGTLDVTKLTGGQFADFETILKDPSQVISNLHRIMAVLYHQHKKYSGEGFNERADLFQSRIPFGHAYALAFFFLKKWDALSSLVQIYFEKETLKATKQMKRMLPKQDFTTGGVTSPSSTK